MTEGAKSSRLRHDPARIQRLRERAAKYDEEVLEALANLDMQAAKLATKRASACEQMADLLEQENAEAGTWTGTDDSGTVDEMEATQVSSRAASLSRAHTNPETRTLFQEALQRSGQSLPEWAAKQANLSVNTAKSWVKPGGGGRAIPEAWAKRIAREFKLPDLRKPESWPHGIRTRQGKVRRDAD